MQQFGKLLPALAIGLLASCAARMPSLPEIPALPAIPMLTPGPVAGDPACGGSWRLEDGGGLAVTAAAEGLR